MTSPTLENFREQFAADPHSQLFREYAAACIAEGDFAGAVEICQLSLQYHPHSIVGYLLWGKALVESNDPAAAMQPFDAAIDLDKANPTTFIFIAQTLLAKGLYRSTLPMLRKALALTDDPGLQQLYDDTKAALEGGSPPEYVDVSAEALNILAAREIELAQHAEGGAPAEQELLLDEEVPGTPQAPGLLEAVPLVTPTRPAPLLDLEGVPMASEGQRESEKEDLLADIPLLPQFSQPMNRSPVDPRASANKAKDYARSLAAELEAREEQGTFLQRHGIKLGVLAVLVVGAAALGGSYWYTRAANDGETFESATAKALSEISLDTNSAYAQALKLAEKAQGMDKRKSLPAVIGAYARAMMYANYSNLVADRDAALAAMTEQNRAEYPEYALAIDYLTSSEAGRAKTEDAILSSSLNKSLIHAHAGRILLERGKPQEALASIKKALDLEPKRVYALAALGDYYLSFEDYQHAQEIFVKALELSKLHPRAVIGQAEVALAVGKDMSQTLTNLQDIPEADIPLSERGRALLLLGELLAANHQPEKAISVLERGLQANSEKMSLPFKLALAKAYRRGGRMELAQKAVERALEQTPDSPQALEALGRVLIARNQPQEVLSRIKQNKDSRPVSLVRGIAYTRLKDVKRAREELLRTQENGKFPVEAVVFLALLDAAEDSKRDKAIETLSKIAESNLRQKSLAQLALGYIYKTQQRLDKAEAAFEQASQDPTDFEANAQLGLMRIDLGNPEAALEPLKRAAERNDSIPAVQHFYIRTLLTLGQFKEALTRAQAWATDAPDLEFAQLDLALALLGNGKSNEALAAINRTSKDSENVELWRTRARIQFALGLNDAAASLQRANSINPKDAPTFCEIGLFYVRVGQYDNAIDAYRRAKDLDPQLACAIAGPLLARPSSGADGNGRSPRELLNSLIAKTKDSWERASVQATLARVYIEDKDLKLAQAVAQDATQTAPANPAGWYALALARERLNELTPALEAAEQAASLDKSWLEIHLLLGSLRARQGNTKGAEESLKLVESRAQSDALVRSAKREIAALKNRTPK